MTIAAIHIIQIFNIPFAASVDAMKLVDEPSMKKHKNTTGYRAVDIDWVMNVKMSILIVLDDTLKKRRITISQHI